MSNLCYAFGDSTCVNTGEVKLNYKELNKDLSTSFINTCCALGFHVNGFNFLAHVDDMTPNMYNKIISKLQIISSNLKDIKNIHVWVGMMCTTKSNCGCLKICKKVIKYINKPVTYHNDDNNIIIMSDKFI